MTDLNYTVTVVTDADHNGLLDYMYGLVGWWGGSGMSPMCMGSMGGVSRHGDEHETAYSSALGLLRRCYASGELTDEQFDMMRDKLEEP